MWEKFKKWFKEKFRENALYYTGLCFIWLMPIVFLIVLSTETHDAGKSIQCWGLIVLLVMFFIYLAKGKAVINRYKERKYDKLGYVPCWIRVVQCILTGSGLAFACMFVNIAKDMYGQVLRFLGAISGSIAVGYIFLFLDSYKKEHPKKPEDAIKQAEEENRLNKELEETEKKDI